MVGLSSSSAIVFLDGDQVADAMEHAAGLRRVLHLDRVADAVKPERAQRLALGVVRAVLGLGLGDLHSEVASSDTASLTVSAGSGEGSSGPVASAAAS